MAYIKTAFKWLIYFVITAYIIIMSLLIFGDYIRNFNDFLRENREKKEEYLNIEKDNNNTVILKKDNKTKNNKDKNNKDKTINSDDNNCKKGFQNNYTVLNCYSYGITELSEGWLRVKETYGYFSIGSNSLKNLNNLNNLEIAHGNLIISLNSLKNVNELSNLKMVNNTFSLSQNDLEDIKGLSNLEKVGNDLSLASNNLMSLQGLENLKYVGGYLFINGNNLIHLSNLKSLKTVARSIHMNDNKNLKDIQGICDIETREVIVSENMNIDKKCFFNTKVCGSGNPLNHKFIYSASRNKANFKDFCNLY